MIPMTVELLKWICPNCGDEFELTDQMYDLFEEQDMCNKCFLKNLEKEEPKKKVLKPRKPKKRKPKVIPKVEIPEKVKVPKVKIPKRKIEMKKCPICGQEYPSKCPNCKTIPLDFDYLEMKQGNLRLIWFD